MGSRVGDLDDGNKVGNRVEESVAADGAGVAFVLTGLSDGLKVGLEVEGTRVGLLVGLIVGEREVGKSEGEDCRVGDIVEKVGKTDG